MSGVPGFSIDMLERAAGCAGIVENTSSAIASRLRDGTASLDGAWGDDMYGEQFAEIYLRTRDASVVEGRGRIGGAAGSGEGVRSDRRCGAGRREGAAETGGAQQVGIPVSRTIR